MGELDGIADHTIIICSFCFQYRHVQCEKLGHDLSNYSFKDIKDIV